MWPILVFLILIFNSCDQHACAEENLLGRILSIDQRRGNAAIEVLSGPVELMKSNRYNRSLSSRGQFQKDVPSPVVITINRNLLPKDSRANSIVRIWGYFDQKRGQFYPSRSSLTAPPDYSGESRECDDDMTGVRQRLRGGSWGGMIGLPGMGGPQRGGRGGPGGGCRR